MNRQVALADRVKWSFFALMGLCVLMVLWTDERFWLNPADPHWKHIEPVRLSADAARPRGGDRARCRRRPDVEPNPETRTALHRTLGKVYIVAVCISAPVAIYMGTSTLEPRSIRVEQVFQGGFWLLSALIAWACIRSGQMALHKAWMMRSYAFTLIFVTSRVPDAWISLLQRPGPVRHAVGPRRHRARRSGDHPHRTGAVANPRAPKRAPRGRRKPRRPHRSCRRSSPASST